MTGKMPGEMFRRVRLGDIRRLLLARCGRVLPDDDAGRDYLLDLLAAMSLAKNPRPGMVQASKDWAPWAWKKCNIEKTIDDILALPAKARRISAEQLGARLRLTLKERARLGIRTIAPCDVTAEQFAEWRKAKDRERKKRRRARVPREAWLANSLSKTQPWKAEGISRRTWERRRKADASVSAMNLNLPGHTCDTDQAAPPMEGKGREEAEKMSAPAKGAPSITLNLKQYAIVTRLRASPEAKRTHLRHERREA